MSAKTEKATTYKLQKAKEHGKVSKSTELNTCVFLLALLISAMTLWPSFLADIKQLFIQLFCTINRVDFNIDSMMKMQQIIWSKMIYLWLPFAITGIITIALSSIVQTGFVWSIKPLSPDFKRLDLANGFKRLFSTKLLFEAGKNSLKLILACLLLFVSIRYEMARFPTFMFSAPSNFPVILMKLLSKLMSQLLLLLLTLAIIDKLYTRWKFAKDNRMSKQEVKDEYKQREGCPKIKAKIRQLQQQLRQKTASLKNVKTADVVITNPTHLAVVLKYDRYRMPAPKVVCKAEGELVKHVKLIAARHQIPIIENKVFARALFATTNLNQWINREHFPVAAMIFREIYRQKEII